MKEILFLFSLVATNAFSQEHGSTESRKVRLNLSSQKSVTIDEGEFQIERIMYDCPSGKCVAILRNHGKVDAFVPKTSEIAKVLEGNPQSEDDNGFLYFDPGSPWCDLSLQEKSNCHAFALSKFVELDPTQWISGLSGPLSGRTPTAATLAEEFFVLKKSIQVSELKDLVFSKDAEFEDGDLIQFRRGAGFRLAILHSGRICKKAGENWVISKLEGGPILVTPIRSLLDRYTQPTDKVEIFRFHGASKKQ